MRKKGQIGLFIVIGFVLVIAAGFLIYTNANSKVKEPEIKQSFELSLVSVPVKSYVEACIQNTAKEGLLFIGLQGGYYNNPPLFESYALLSIPYYFYLGANHFPSLESIEKELSQYIEENLPYCIDDFKSFNEIGYKISYSNSTIKANSRIGLENINLLIQYPISINKNNDISELKEYSSDINFNFNKIYSIVKYIILEQEKEKDSMPIGFIMDSAVTNNFIFEIIYPKDDSVIYTLIFNESKINNEHYIYDFAVKYDWASLNQSQSKVILYDMPNLTAVVSENFIYHVKAFGDNLIYIAYTDLFNINTLTGFIEFTPKEADKGVHRIIVKVKDENGNEDINFLKLTIVAENEPPVLEKIEDQTAKIGQNFYYKSKASDPNGDTLLFNAETSLPNFKIHPLTGEINFKPEANQAGNYTISIVAVDIKGSTDKQTFRLEVK